MFTANLLFEQTLCPVFLPGPVSVVAIPCYYWRDRANIELWFGTIDTVIKLDSGHCTFYPFQVIEEPFIILNCPWINEKRMERWQYLEKSWTKRKLPRLSVWLFSSLLIQRWKILQVFALEPLLHISLIEGARSGWFVNVCALSLVVLWPDQEWWLCLMALWFCASGAVDGCVLYLVSLRPLLSQLHLWRSDRQKRVHDR